MSPLPPGPIVPAIATGVRSPFPVLFCLPQTFSIHPVLTPENPPQTSPLPTNGLFYRDGLSWPPPYRAGVQPGMTAMALGLPVARPSHSPRLIGTQAVLRSTLQGVMAALVILASGCRSLSFTSGPRIVRTSMSIPARPITSTAHIPADPCAVKAVLLTCW
ncbi:hypothetical protein C8Q70DRAFT_311678 [Cubamyces menziesii]|nr:hypothetical protein C8Q70DRAFT_311678 [Cubamyces menziesii]